MHIPPCLRPLLAALLALVLLIPSGCMVELTDGSPPPVPTAVINVNNAAPPPAEPAPAPAPPPPAPVSNDLPAEPAPPAPPATLNGTPVNSLIPITP